MGPLTDLWPDPDRREAALLRLADRLAKPDRELLLSSMDLRCLEGMSHGLGRKGTAQVLGIGEETVADHLTRARRTLQAKDTTHACCEAIRQGLIG